MGWPCRIVHADVQKTPVDTSNAPPPVAVGLVHHALVAALLLHVQVHKLAVPLLSILHHHGLGSRSVSHPELSCRHPRVTIETASCTVAAISKPVGQLHRSHSIRQTSFLSSRRELECGRVERSFNPTGPGHVSAAPTCGCFLGPIPDPTGLLQRGGATLSPAPGPTRA